MVHREEGEDHRVLSAAGTEVGAMGTGDPTKPLYPSRGSLEDLDKTGMEARALPCGKVVWRRQIRGGKFGSREAHLLQESR